MAVPRGVRGAGRVVLGVALLVAGCGGSTPPAPATAKTGPAQVAAEPPPDLSPVAAPEDLIVVGRLRDPAALLDTLGTWSGSPLDWRGLVAREEPGLENVIAWDAPVEAAVALDLHGAGTVPRPFVVFSVGLTSLDAATKLAEGRGYRPTRVRPGVLRLGRAIGGSCALAAAVGRAPARLVCGKRDRDLEALLPYATRGLPTEVMVDTDLHVEVRVAPLRRRFGPQLRQLKTLALPFVLRQMSLDHPRFDRALADGIHMAADEVLALSDELERATLDVRLKRDAGVAEATTVLELSATQSLTGSILLDGATHSAAPPEAFWKLPATATSASFDHGGDPKRYARIQRTLAELVGGFLEHEKAPARTVQRVVELVETAPLLGRAAVYAEGDLPASVPRPTDAAQRARYDFGWRWIGFAEPPASLRRWLDGLTAASADRALRRLVEERFNLVTGALPSVKRRPARGMAPGSTTYEIALPAGLAAGGGMLQTLFKTPDLAGAKAGGKPAQRPVSVVLVLVPDGDRTWLGAAGDEASLAAPLRAIRQGADQDRLARREGLEWLRPLSAASGGFLTLRSFAGGLASLAGAGEPNHASARDVRGVLDTLPHRAQAPAPYATTMTRERGLQAAWTVRLPKAVLTDMAALLPAMIALGGSPPPTVP